MNHNLVIEQNSRSAPNLVGSVANNISNVAGLDANSAQSFLRYFEQNRDYNNAWSASQARIQREWQEQQNAKAMEFNRSEAAKNRNWQEIMSNTAHQREVQDLISAGLNPVLSAMNGNGAAVTSGSTASGVTSSGAAGQTDNSVNQMMVTLLGSFLDAQTKLQAVNINAINNLAVADKQGEINKTLATMNINFDKSLSYQNYLQSNNLQDSKYSWESFLSHLHHYQDIERDYHKFLRDNDLQNNKYAWEDYLKQQYPTMLGLPIGAADKAIQNTFKNFGTSAKSYFSSGFKSDLNDVIGTLTGSRWVPFADFY